MGFSLFWLLWWLFMIQMHLVESAFFKLQIQVLVNFVL